MLETHLSCEAQYFLKSIRDVWDEELMFDAQERLESMISTERIDFIALLNEVYLNREERILAVSAECHKGPIGNFDSERFIY